MEYSKKQKELLNSIGIIDYENIDWKYISANQTLSEDFIREFNNYVSWSLISRHQKLSENFISEFKDMVGWSNISKYQNLSLDFIREFKDNIDWNVISKYQKLSEYFISEFKDYVEWEYISEYQILSEKFICEFKDNINWYVILKYQKLNSEFINKFNLTINEDNWLYKSTEFKKQAIIDSGLYECYDDHFIAYKAIRTDRYSKYNFQYQYLPNQYYTAHCDCTNEENSFGLSVWNEEGAKVFGEINSLIVRVKVNYEDVGRLVIYENKIRCSKIFVLE